MSTIKLFESKEHENGDFSLNDYMQYWTRDFWEIRKEIIENPNYKDIFGDEKPYDEKLLKEWDNSQSVSFVDKTDLLWQILRNNAKYDVGFINQMKSICKNGLNQLGKIEDAEYFLLKEKFSIPDFDIDVEESWRKEFHERY